MRDRVDSWRRDEPDEDYEYPAGDERFSRHDYDKDGSLNEREVSLAKLLNDIEIKAKKLESQKKMAWFSLVMIAVVTFFLFTPIVTDKRIEALSDLIGLFYISCAGITGAYVGVTAWISRK